MFKLVRLDPHDERFQRDMFERTVRDTLTGLYHRTYFLSQIGVLAERYAASGQGMAVLMLDIDHFKRINDQFGHVAGDEVLREVATVIRESTRTEDLVARYGGEEFVFALPVSLAVRAVQRAERIRLELAKRRIVCRQSSCPLDCQRGARVQPSRLGTKRTARSIISADQSLYQAKAQGRNRVVSAPVYTADAAQRTESSILIAVSTM